MKTVVLGLMLVLGLTLPVSAADLVVPGTGDGVAVLNALSVEFKKRAGFDVEFPKSIGSSGGIVAAGTGQAEIARVAREIKGKEAEYGLTYKPIFRIPTVFYITKDVAIKNLTRTQIIDIFSGKIVNWAAVGGENKEIKVIARETTDSSLESLRETFPGFGELKFPDKAIVARKTPDMLLIMTHEKSAIGFGPLDVAIENKITYVSVDGVKAQDANYKYKGNIGLVFKNGKLSPAAKTFLEFVDTKEASKVISDFGGTSL